MSSSSRPGAAHLRIEAVGNQDVTCIEMHGEADVSNSDHLKAALDGIHLDGAKTVQLDVSDLSFVDVAALRHLTSFAIDVKNAGRTVRTSGAQPTLHRMALLLDVQEELGLP